MYAALYAFLILTSIDNLFRLWQSGTDHDASDGIRFFGGSTRVIPRRIRIPSKSIKLRTRLVTEKVL